MRARSLLVPLAALAALAACRHRSEESAPTFAAMTSANEAVKATVTGVETDDRDLRISLRLANTGSEAVQFRSPESVRVSGFKAAADGREAVGCDAGRFESTKSPAAQLKELAPGATSKLELKWSFEPRLAHDTYRWTLTISNMYVGDRKLADISFVHDPEPK